MGQRLHYGEDPDYGEGGLVCGQRMHTFIVVDFKARRPSRSALDHRF